MSGSMLFDSHVVKPLDLKVSDWITYARRGPHVMMWVLPSRVEARVTWLHRVVCFCLDCEAFGMHFCASPALFSACCRLAVVARVSTHLLPGACPYISRAEVASFPPLVDHR